MSSKTHLACLSVILFFTFSVSTAQDVQLDWAYTFHGSGGPSSGSSVVTDSLGNSYSVGGFSGTVDFDPGPDSSFLTSYVTSKYILKLDPVGNFLWAKRIDGQTVNSLTLDVSGNLVLAGNYGGYNDFDPGEDTLSFSSLSWDAFVLKLSPLGDLIWAKTFGGFGADIILSMESDDLGNIYTTGTFIGTADFDPSTEVDEHSAYNWDPFYPKTDLFISKLDSDGEFVWAKAIGGPYDDQGSSIDVDGSGNSYITGFYYDTVDFDPNAGVNNQTASITNNAPRKEVFVMKLNTLGNLEWVNSIGDVASDEGRSVALDNSGDLLVFGSFFGTVNLDFGPGVHEVTSTGNYDGFILKLNEFGELIWAAHNIPEESAVDIDPDGNMYLLGSFSGTVDFDPGPDSLILSSNTSYPFLYVQKINPLGGLEWVVTFQHTLNAWQTGSAIEIDQVGNIFLTGGFLHTIDFDPGPDSLIYTTNLPAAFILKLVPDSYIGIESRVTSKNIGVYPNPSSGLVNIEFQKPMSGFVEIKSYQGQLLETITLENASILSTNLNGTSGPCIISIHNRDGEVEVLTVIKH
jgi:hypothetical protein